MRWPHLTAEERRGDGPVLEHCTGEAVNVPEDLLRRLVSLKARLSRCGAVVTRRESDRRGSYCVRYRDEVIDRRRRPHRSIPLGGNDAVAEAVREMLAEWRRQRRERIRAEREAHRSSARAVRLEAEEHRRSRKII